MKQDSVAGTMGLHERAPTHEPIVDMTNIPSPTHNQPTFPPTCLSVHLLTQKALLCCRSSPQTLDCIFNAQDKATGPH
eukprot:867788-Pelagomonas_calceolata.AAC.4